MSIIDNNQKVTVVSRKSFLNIPNGFKAVQDWIIKNHYDIALVLYMEATGVYH